MDRAETHRESFLDLFYRGVEDAVEMIDLLARFVVGAAPEVEIREKLTDISHSTGKLYADQREMLHFRPLLP
jgi:hypothetical protein